MEKQLRAYLVVTAAYWSFTLTDGALRMLVLGHFHKLGYSPFALAMLFLLYELFGAFTNLVGGWIASRTGFRLTLVTGLSLQVLALLLLSGLSVSWPHSWQVAYVIAAQGLSGIAKDFTKLSAKSAIKVLVPDDASGTLFRWVALLTGSKNALKGLGFFLGGLLLATLGFDRALWAMAAALALVTALVWISLPAIAGRGARRFRFSDSWGGSRAVKILSLARLLLFGARDIWFVVGLPVYLSEVLGWSFFQIGSYLALWIVGYGAVQALAPRILPRLGRQQINDARAATLWALALALVPLALVAAIELGVSPKLCVLAGLALFGVVFAINSAVHSYLILALSPDGKVSLNVGFYYMSNALGRLLGTLLSGLLYQWGGLEACLAAASGMLLLASAVTSALPDTRGTDHVPV